MRRAGRFRAPLLALALGLVAINCAHTRLIDSAPLSPALQEAARARLQARALPPPLWAANGLLVAYGHGERVRTRVQMLVAAPHQFRLTAIGPHNAAVAVVASDGQQLTTLEARSSQTTRVPATREGLMQLSGGFDVGLPIQTWLSLLSFAMAVPIDAIAYERPHGQVAWSWQAPGQTAATIILADAKGRIVAAQVPQADGHIVHASFLPPSDEAAPAVAKEIDVRVVDAAGHTDSSLSLSFEQVQPNPSLAPGTTPFVVGIGAAP